MISLSSYNVRHKYACNSDYIISYHHGAIEFYLLPYIQINFTFQANQKQDRIIRWWNAHLNKLLDDFAYLKRTEIKDIFTTTFPISISNYSKWIASHVWQEALQQHFSIAILIIHKKAIVH